MTMTVGKRTEAMTPKPIPSGSTAVMSRQPCMFPGAALRPDGWPFGDLEPWSYDLIMADPPWRFELWSEAGEGKSAQAQYATMGLDAIAGLPVGELAAPDCLLWLWATAPMLPQALVVIERWGFRYVTMGFWAKRTRHDKAAFGTGYVLRSAGEPFLIGKRGDPVTTRGVRNVVMGRVREHSRKPDEAYAAAEKLMPEARRVELFSRERRPGWAAWGNETGKFNAAEKAPEAA
jgi:N6-adenosine-specific RNA methylase IME4